ncbi:PP2C family protein-serine/threonine phosphatase [Demequina subtropica]|uniref:PP2C family protein-serine/threonine phosphatase n=1 Tax=Demequina subtropica TaxID=1638989 RepID=UPI000781D265|nr:protein phosphatase 2C domain-containing protein [Demequina subtropica]
MTVLDLCGGGATATGRRRANEDSLLAEAPAFIVADGMGGHAAGAEASQAVIEAFRPLAGRIDVEPAEAAGCVDRAREAVSRVANIHGAQSGSTVTGAVGVALAGVPWWLVLNVGDSRVYSYGAGTLEQVTRDHSRVQELVDAGQLSPEEAEAHPERNVVTRAIGDGGTGVDVWLVPRRRGRTLVAVSDGLVKALSDAQIGQLLAHGGEPGALAQGLVDAAVAAGARDNVTVVVARADGQETPAGAETYGWPVWTGVVTDDALAAAVPTANVASPSVEVTGMGESEPDDATVVPVRLRGEPEPEPDADDATVVSARLRGEPEPEPEPDDATVVSARLRGESEPEPEPDDATVVSARLRGEPSAPIAAPPASSAPSGGPHSHVAVLEREAPERITAELVHVVAPPSVAPLLEPSERQRRVRAKARRARATWAGVITGTLLAMAGLAALEVYLISEL